MIEENEVVYLCGGINGLTNSQCSDWREEAKAQLHCLTLDPMRRDYRGKEDVAYKEIIDGDKEDIQNSDILLVNATRPSWGTAMEIMYAYELDKTIIAVVGDKISPWLRYHATWLEVSFEAAIERINQ